MVVGDWRSLPAFLLTLTTVAACDGEIQVQGTVYSTEGQRVPSANVGLYDRRLSDGFDAYLRSEDPACLMRWDQGAVTGADGRYETRATVAGNGRHDFWIVVTKEGLPSVAYRAWKGKGFPENRIDLDIVLASE